MLHQQIHNLLVYFCHFFTIMGKKHTSEKSGFIRASITSEVGSSKYGGLGPNYTA